MEEKHRNDNSLNLPQDALTGPSGSTERSHITNQDVSSVLTVLEMQNIQ